MTATPSLPTRRGPKSNDTGPEELAVPEPDEAASSLSEAKETAERRAEEA
jgi:hypothetical protein